MIYQSYRLFAQDIYDYSISYYIRSNIMSLLSISYGNSSKWIVYRIYYNIGNVMTENPHVTTAAGGILYAIFDGFAASLICEEEGQGRRKRCSKQV